MDKNGIGIKIVPNVIKFNSFYLFCTYYIFNGFIIKIYIYKIQRNIFILRFFLTKSVEIIFGINFMINGLTLLLNSKKIVNVFVFFKFTLTSENLIKPNCIIVLYSDFEVRTRDQGLNEVIINQPK